MAYIAKILEGLFSMVVIDEEILLLSIL